MLIVPYCLFFGLDSTYLNQFEPDSEAFAYESYSDFFKRKFKKTPIVQSDLIWPCEGYVCDWGFIKDKQITTVKGQKIEALQIFGEQHQIALDEKSFFINIFLHNHNYHRIHAPTELKVESIDYVSGDLVFLRPWFYSIEQVSKPALLNERATIRFSDENNQAWLITFVAGFGVGGISLESFLKPGSIVQAGQEIGHFQLGSTICMVTPFEVTIDRYLQPVKAFDVLEFKHHQNEHFKNDLNLKIESNV